MDSAFKGLDAVDPAPRPVPLAVAGRPLTVTAHPGVSASPSDPAICAQHDRPENCILATMFELGTDGPSTVVVGVDGSTTSMRAGAYAAGLARRQRSRLVVVHVLAVGGLASLVPAGQAAIRQANLEVAEDLRRQVAEAAEARGVAVTFVAVQGDPYLELVRIADQVRADVIVVGASSKRIHRLAGSLAIRLVRAGRWPVTVVP
jgi:nucleotide-binding universal stress UspA family protein